MIVLSMALTVVGAAAALPPWPPDKNCDSPDAGVIARCTWEQYQAWDKALNAEYKSVSERIPDNVRPLLVRSQRAWIQYRDANCAILASREGVVATYYSNRCLLDMTRSRTRELRLLPDEVES